MVDSADVMWKVSCMVDTQPLHAALQHMRESRKELPHQILIDTCLDGPKRRSVVGCGLDAYLHTAASVPEADCDLVAGLLLLLHLCDPAQHGVDTAAAACAAFAALLADGSHTDPSHSPQHVRYIADKAAATHSSVFIAAMQHDGLAAKVARLRPDAVVVLAVASHQGVDGATGQQAQQADKHNSKVFEAFEAGAIEAASYIASLPHLSSREHLHQAGLATFLLHTAAMDRRGNASTILQVAVDLQTVCLRSRPDSSSGSSSSSSSSMEGLRATRQMSAQLWGLSQAMHRASAAAFEAARQMLSEQHTGQEAPATDGRPVAEAALESILQAARWVCEPLQGSHPEQRHFNTHEAAIRQLIAEAGGGEGSSKGRGGSSGAGGFSLCAAAVAAAGQRQVESCALGLADALTVAAVRTGAEVPVWQLAAAARVLLCMCGMEPSHDDVAAADSKISSSASTHTHNGSGSRPITMHCLRSRQGAQLLRTRVEAPATVLAAAVSWFDDSSNAPLSHLLRKEARDEGAAGILPALAQLVDDMAALLAASVLQLLGGACSSALAASKVLQLLQRTRALVALCAALQLPPWMTRMSGAEPAPLQVATQRQRQPCSGLSGGCRQAVQALAAAVAVGELAICAASPAGQSPQPTSRGTTPAAPAAAAAAAAAADNVAAVAQAAGRTTATAATAEDGPEAAAPAAVSQEPATQELLMRLMHCCLVLGEQAQRFEKGAMETLARRLAAEKAGSAAAASGNNAAGSKMRRLQSKAVEAEVQAAREASSRLLATAVAGLAGLTSAAAAAALQRFTKSAAVTQQFSDAEDDKTLALLLERSVELATEAMIGAERMPEFAADFIEGACAILAGVAVAAPKLSETLGDIWRESREPLRRLLGQADLPRLHPMFVQVDVALQGGLSRVAPCAADLHAHRAAAAAAKAERRKAAAATAADAAAAAAEVAAMALLQDERSSAAAGKPGHGSPDAQAQPGSKKAAKRARQKAAKAAGPASVEQDPT